MVLIAVLVFLVLRQVMPIASGLAGGASLNSFGLISRGVGGGLRSVRERSRKPREAAITYATRGVGIAIRGVGIGMRKVGSMVRGADVKSSRNADRKAGAGTDRLGETWRQMRD
jgi:hypothetical protein